MMISLLITLFRIFLSLLKLPQKGDKNSENKKQISPTAIFIFSGVLLISLSLLALCEDKENVQFESQCSKYLN